MTVTVEILNSIEVVVSAIKFTPTADPILEYNQQVITTIIKL